MNVAGLTPAVEASPATATPSGAGVEAADPGADAAGGRGAHAGVVAEGHSDRRRRIDRCRQCDSGTGAPAEHRWRLLERLDRG